VLTLALPYIDLGRNSTTLCNTATTLYPEEIYQLRHSRTVSVQSHLCFSLRTSNIPCRRRALLRSQILRSTASKSPLPPSYYFAISQHLSQSYEKGTYLKEGPPKDTDKPAGPVNPLSDPTAMEGMMESMKGQMVMMVPQMVIMGWINFFFEGFVLSRLLLVWSLGRS
jgi:hypothetical protein